MKLFKDLPKIIEKLIQISAIELSEYWEIKTTEKKKVDDWIELVSLNCKKIVDANHLDVKKIMIEIIASK